MYRIILPVGLFGLLLTAPPDAAAQSPAIDLPQFDVVGLKLGQPLPKAVEILKKHNPKFRIEIRRVGLQKWDNEPGCVDELKRVDDPFPGPRQCGNWSDGMEFSEVARKAQQEIRPDDSLVAGVIAYDDQREFGPIKGDRHSKWRSVVRAGEEAIALVFTPEPGKEKLVLISRAKTFARDTIGFDDLKSQIFPRYVTPDSIVDGLQNTSPRGFWILNLFHDGKPLSERRDRRAFQNCNRVSAGDYRATGFDFENLQVAWPDTAAARCGDVIRVNFKSFHDNNRYAEGFSVLWLDQHALFQLSRDRALAAKAIRDAQFKPSPSPGVKF